jgi:hypothetical protein
MLTAALSDESSVFLRGKGASRLRLASIERVDSSSSRATISIVDVDAAA